MSKPEKAKTTQKKFKVKTWYANRYQLILVQRNILLIFALFSTIAVSFGMIFLNQVTASKSLEPYIIEVDEKTGVPTVVQQMSVVEFTGNELMKNYFLNQFVIAATGYNPRTYPEDSEKIRVLSSADAFGYFKSLISPRDLGTDTNINVKIKSIQFSNENTAQVRILRETVKGLTEEKSEKHELVTINFLFDPNIQLNVSERMMNPLGFQVKFYSVVEEAITY